MEIGKRFIIRKKYNASKKTLSVDELIMLKRRFVVELKSSIDDNFIGGVGWFLGFDSALAMIDYEIVDIVLGKEFDISKLIREFEK